MIKSLFPVFGSLFSPKKSLFLRIENSPENPKRLTVCSRYWMHRLGRNRKHSLYFPRLFANSAETVSLKTDSAANLPSAIEVSPLISVATPIKPQFLRVFGKATIAEWSGGHCHVKSVAGARRGRYGRRMTPISFKRHRFPPEIIQLAVWLYARFTLSFRDVEDLPAGRGIDVSNETVRRWFLKFGRLIAGNLRRRRPRASARRHLDEMVIKIRGPEIPAMAGGRR